MWDAVGTPTARISSFEYALDPSMRAAAAVGPNARIPSSVRASTRPATSGASGPTTTRSMPSSLAARTIPSTSSAAISRHGTRSPAMPALPGAQTSSGRWGLRRRARTIACSRPPPPTTNTFIRCSVRSGPRSERGDELVDRNGHERLVAGGASRAQLERHARDRLLVGRLDDVDEVVLAEDGPLGLHGGAELLDLAIHLADPAGLFLSVATPSGVSVVRRMNVGKAAP